MLVKYVLDCGINIDVPKQILSTRENVAVFRRAFNHKVILI